MDVFRIEGGNRLSGTVKISGAKNSALPLFAASLLSPEETILHNVPNLSDVQFMAEILEHLGAKVENFDTNSWRITPQEINPDPPYELVRKMRASICLLGPLVGRLKKANMPMPGGCVIGNRPIDLHLKALSDLGADIQLQGGVVKVRGEQMKGSSLFIGGRHGSTVTGTANAIMASVLTPGNTRLEGCACEPEIIDLCQMLSSMGAQIEGIGSHLLKIEGVDALHGCTHHVIPDRIEAATYILASTITGGEITLQNASIDHLGAFTNVMTNSGVSLDKLENGDIQVTRSARRTKLSGNYHPSLPRIPHRFTGTNLCPCLQDTWLEYSNRKSLPQPFHAHPGIVTNGSKCIFRRLQCHCPRGQTSQWCSSDGIRFTGKCGINSCRTGSRGRNLGTTNLSPRPRI